MERGVQRSVHGAAIGVDHRGNVVAFDAIGLEPVVDPGLGWCYPARDDAGSGVELAKQRADGACLWLIHVASSCGHPGRLFDGPCRETSRCVRLPNQAPTALDRAEYARLAIATDGVREPRTQLVIDAAGDHLG